jgi:branched-subunit amino acid aminotransferase/4-amino-4-deoxychorismate lyase
MPLFSLNFNLVATLHDLKDPPELHNDDDNNDGSSMGQQIQFFSVSDSPRLWLESQPDGAYTVLRCDWFQTKASWNVWGLDFHLQRLQTSYQLFVRDKAKENDDEDQNALETDNNFSQATMHRAVHDTRILMDQLLQRAEKILADDGNNLPAVFMLTMLWHPNSSTRRVPIIQGHICKSPIGAVDEARVHPDSLPFQTYDPTPVTAIIALPPPPMTWADDTLPNRKPYPQAKLSSWCRERRLLEQMFLSSTDTGNNPPEILLVDCCSSSSKNEANPGDSSEFVLLEGLTSNIFVLYRDDQSLRTAPDKGVLPGYARHIVLQSEVTTETAFFPEDRKTICMADVEQWEQVFITSSIRLITPVQRILVPIYKNDHNGDIKDIIDRFEVFWTQKSSRPPVWKPIYHTLIQMQYGAIEERG